MTEQELYATIFPAKLTRRRKIVINVIMACVTLVVAWLFNSPDSPLFVGLFQ
jgi:hypothetical protein